MDRWSQNENEDILWTHRYRDDHPTSVVAFEKMMIRENSRRDLMPDGFVFPLWATP